MPILGVNDLLDLAQYLKTRRRPQSVGEPLTAPPPQRAAPVSSFMPGESGGMPNEQWRQMGYPANGPNYLDGPETLGDGPNPRANLVPQQIPPLTAPIIRPTEAPTYPNHPAINVPATEGATIDPNATPLTAPPPVRPPLVRSSEAGLAPHVIDAKGRATSKPVMPNTGDPHDLEDYRQQLETWRNPKGGSRWKSALKMFGLGALRGLGSGQGLAGALGGGIAGAAYGAISPNIDERTWRNQELGRVEGLQTKQAAKQDVAMKRRLLGAQTAKTEAEAISALTPKPVSRQHVKINDRAYTFDPSTGTYTDANLPGKGKRLQKAEDELGPYFYDPDNPTAQIVRPTGAELKQFVDVPGYGRMTPAAKYTADQAAGERETQREERFGDRKYSADVSEWSEAQREQTRLQSAVADMDKAVAERDAAVAIDDPDTATEAGKRAEALRVTAMSINNSLKGKFPSLVDPDERGWFTGLKPRPVIPEPAAPTRAPRRGTKPTVKNDPLGLFK